MITNVTKFLCRIDVSGGPDACWPWRGAHHGKDGRGMWNQKGHHVSAPRVMWELVKGESPGELLVCHSCDNAWCMNPSHLWLGDNQANLLDASTKGRLACQLDPSIVLRGSQIGNAKLTEEYVLAIRKIGPGRSKKELAQRFGVSRSAIQLVLAGKTWRHI